MAKKKYKSEEEGHYGGVPSENVASEEIGYDSEQGVVIAAMDDVDLDYTREDGK